MADIYKGLTIRIGADTQPLTRALGTVNSALKNVQSSMRLVQKGLKFDPTSLTSTKQNLSLLSEKMELLGVKSLDFQKALDQVKQKTPWIANMAESSRHLAAETEVAQTKFNELTRQLEVFKDKYEAMADKQGALDKNDFRKTLDNLRKLGLIQDDVIENYNQMAATHVRWNDQLTRLQEANKVRRVLQDMQELKNETKAAAQEYAKLYSKMAFENVTGIDGNKIASGRGELERLDNVQKELLQHAELLAEAWRLDPTNMARMTAAGEAFDAAVDVGRLKLDELKRQLKELDDNGIQDSKLSMEQLSAASDKAEKKLAECVAEENRLRSIADKLISDIETVNEKTASSKVKKQLQEDRAELQKVTAEIGKAESKTEKAKAEVEEIQGIFKKQTIKREIEKIEAETDIVTSKQKKWDAAVKNTRTHYAALRDLGTTFANTVSPLATAALYRTVSAADDLDSAYRDMRKTVDGTEEQFEDLKQAAIEFSETSIVSAADILEIEAMAGQLGIAVDNLETFATVASNLDIATDIESEEIAKSMGQLANIMGWSQDIVDGTRSDYEKFGDALVRLGNNFPAQESAIMKITTRIAPMGALIDMSTDKVLAWSTALASTGQGSEAAGTALARTMSQIEGAVAEGGDSLDKFANVAQMSSEDFAALWNKDASAAMKRFIWGLKDIDEKGGSVDATLQGMEITAVRQKQALEGLVNTYDVLDEALGMSAAAWALGGDAAEEARKKSEGFSGTYHMLLNNGKALAAALGEGLVPFMKLGIELASKFASWLNNMGQAGKSAIAGFIGLVAASGPLFRLWGQGQLYLEAHANNLSRVGKEAGKLSKKWNSLSKSMKAGYAALAAVAVVLATIVVSAIADAIKFSKDYTKATDGLLEVVGLGPKNFKNFNKGLKDMSSRIKKVDMKKLVEEAAELTDHIAKNRKEAGFQISLLEDYRKTISKVGKDGSIAAEDVADMRVAVDGLNSILGTNYEVSGNAADGYYLMKDGAAAAKGEIYKLIDAMESQISMSMYEDTWQELKKKSKEYSDTLNTNMEEYRKFIAERDKYAVGTEEWNAANMDAEAAWRKVEKTQGLIDSNNEAIEQTKRQMGIVSDSMDESASHFERFIANNDTLNGSLAANGQSARDFETALKDLGISESELAALSETNMSVVAGSFDGTKESIAGFVEDGAFKAGGDFSNAWEETASTTSKTATDMGKALPKKFSKAFSGGISQVSSAVHSLSGPVSNALVSMGGAGEGAGKNLILGLIRGIQDPNTLARLYSTVDSVATNVASKLAHGFDEHSPSKITEQMGAYLMEGLAIGIDENAQLAYKAAQNASDLALAGFGAVTAGEMAVNANNASSMVLNVNFNGVTINDNAAIESQTLDLVMALQQLWRTKAGA